MLTNALLLMVCYLMFKLTGPVHRLFVLCDLDYLFKMAPDSIFLLPSYMRSLWKKE